MKDILLIGSGGREAAIAWKLKSEEEVGTIYAVPGNGGMADICTCVNIDITDNAAVVAFAQEKQIDFAVVTPDNPLVAGMVDALEAAGIPSFGPNAQAAIIEGSKAFAKDFMERWNIPTAQCRIFNEEDKALAYLATCHYPLVLKADGLALGKGVLIVESEAEAIAGVKQMMEDLKFGDSGKTIVIEEFLEGPEISLLCFTDGETIKEMVTSMDHKRIGDGDTGPNTGGMGCIAPSPFYTSAIAKECREKILLPTIRGMKEEKRTFKGCLYFGLMLTKEGTKVIEYNCRFGDPETQVIMPLLQSDLLPIMEATRNGNLADVEVTFKKDTAAACVVLASKGYPVAYEKHKEITFSDGCGLVFCAGVTKEEGKYYTNGGRVMGLSATAPTLKEALAKAYQNSKHVAFTGKYYRTDIGKKALKALGDN